MFDSEPREKLSQKHSITQGLSLIFSGARSNYKDSVLS